MAPRSRTNRLTGPSAGLNYRLQLCRSGRPKGTEDRPGRQAQRSEWACPQWQAPRVGLDATSITMQQHPRCRTHSRCSIKHHSGHASACAGSSGNGRSGRCERQREQATKGPAAMPAPSCFWSGANPNRNTKPTHPELPNPLTLSLSKGAGGTVAHGASTSSARAAGGPSFGAGVPSDVNFLIKRDGGPPTAKFTESDRTPCCMAATM
jgi:hypothetical protein